MKCSTFGLGLKEEVISFSHLARGINVDGGEGVVLIYRYTNKVIIIIIIIIITFFLKGS